MSKGVSQGSIADPFLFNVFLNDIFYFINDTYLYNYADDNTVSYSNIDFNAMKQTLEAGGNVTYFTSKRDGPQPP